MTPSARGKIMRRIAQLIEQQAEHLAQVEVRDNGKLISEMVAQTKYMPEWFYYYGGLTDKIRVPWSQSIAHITSTTFSGSRWASAPLSRRGIRR
jgi:acyl-CoA reductase-like NAD-dependent aldehyde dehydrogenase